MLIDAVNGTSSAAAASAIPAVAGYPHLTVPMGTVKGLPVGLSFIGPRWSDARLLAWAIAFEQISHAWRPPTFMPTPAIRPEVARAFDPPIRR